MKANGKRFIPKLHIRKDDMVLLRSGDDKGKRGRVIEVLPEKRMALVEGINLISRHYKPNTNKQNPKGGIVKKEAPVPVSKLSLIDPKKNTATRIGRKMVDGKMVRYAKKSGEVIK
jgi:large subunit ribosomal protein L24